MSETTDAVLTVLEEWSRQLREATPIAGVYVFGSLVYLGGLQFDRDESDVDLLVVFSDAVTSPVDRRDACVQVLREKVTLESRLQCTLGKTPTSQIASVVPMTRLEFENGIHKDNKPGFFRTTEFRLLGSPPEVPLRQAGFHADSFNARFAYAVQPIRDAQRRRNEFLARRISHHASTDPLPKDLCRSAASLRYFVEETAEAAAADVNMGLRHLVTALGAAASRDATTADLQNRVLARLNRGEARPLAPEDVLLLWEVLAADAARSISDRLARAAEQVEWRPVLRADGEAPSAAPVGKEQWAESELKFLEVTTLPSLRIGDLDLACRVFPAALWTPESRPIAFEDDPESGQQIEIVQLADQLPGDLLASLMRELHATEQSLVAQGGDATVLAKIREALRRLDVEGSNAYPRLAGLPQVRELKIGARAVHRLEIPVAPSRFGIAYLQEHGIDLPSLKELQRARVLNSLGVRCAYVFDQRGQTWMEFHKRKGQVNATYADAWDVGAAGYVDLQNHLDPESRGRISAWQVARHELSEELGIPAYSLPHRDKYSFFGVGRNDPTGQVDILGVCRGVNVPSPTRALTARVAAYDRCPATPRDVAALVLRLGSWVPTALLTCVLVLRQLGFEMREIDEAFAPCTNRLRLA